MIKLDSNICGNFEISLVHEWLETNGIGGYASSTVSGAHSRRYHGLLTAATRPPLGRMVLLSKFEETLILDGKRFELSSNRYPGGIYPDGYKFLKNFRLDPFPVWTFEVNNVEFEKSVFMIYGENSTVCQWKIKSEISNLKCEIELRPLLAFRDHHHLRHEDADFKDDYETGQNLVSIAPYAEMPTLYFAHNAEFVETQGHWYRNFEYAIERERGFDCHEDLFQPFSLRFHLAADARVIVSTGLRSIDDLEACEAAEIERRQEIVNIAGSTDDFSSQLALAADQFIVSRGSGNTVIAGYHWFSDWGRDTMIALNGLTLATNRPEIAKSILTEFSKHISEGMLPNRFPDAGETPEYNTVDASLWYFEAIRAYAAKTGDYDFVREVLFEKLTDIIDWHIRGTRYQIHVDTDGLLFAGGPGVQLTWMDAKVGDWVVTPRTGKAVEIQALWYNALCVMAELAERFGYPERQKTYVSMAETAKGSFNGQFWNDSDRCLFDVVNGGNRDASVRPNQIFTVSLPHTMLNAEKARKVVNKVENDLLTPFGLRSLSPNDPRYVPIYIGSTLERDGSYHQGTVWGWLIGPFVEAYLKVNSNNLTARNRAREIAGNFKKHMAEAMTGQVSEIFDGDPPHTPRGCAAQAWSVAELVRITALASDSNSGA
ncbi:MAG: amylo-alpha-1,6-glucosidase [Pyrinomonadaceae bacterium]